MRHAKKWESVSQGKNPPKETPLRGSRCRDVKDFKEDKCGQRTKEKCAK